MPLQAGGNRATSTGLVYNQLYLTCYAQAYGMTAPTSAGLPHIIRHSDGCLVVATLGGIEKAMERR